MEFETASLYEMNKQLSAKEKAMGSTRRNKAQEESRQWFNNYIKRYAMLLCHDRRDYTVFSVVESAADAAAALFECIDNRGELISFELTPDKAIEIWIRIDEEDYCYYLFNYDNAIIEC